MQRFALIAAATIAAFVGAVSVHAMARPHISQHDAIAAAQASFPDLNTFATPSFAPAKPRASGPRMRPFVPTTSVHRVLLTGTNPAFSFFHRSQQRPDQAHLTRPAPKPQRLLRIQAIAEGRIVPKPLTSLEGSSAVGCLAVAIYHEARNQDITGQRAVASVILQRALVPGRFGVRPCDVVKPVQFSFMTSEYGFPAIDDQEAWERSLRLAAQGLLDGPMHDLQQADHYHTTDVSPAWAAHMIKIRQIDDHIFYADPISIARMEP